MAEIFRSPLTVKIKSRRDFLAPAHNRPGSYIAFLPRGTVVTAIPRRAWLQPAQFVNRLPLGGVAPPVGDPFVPADLPNPRQARRARFEQPERGAIRFPAAPAAQPFGQSDWPTPRRQARRTTDHPTAGALRFPAPVLGRDLPNPSRLRRGVQSEITVNRLPLEAAVSVGPAPFFPLAWPLPLRPARQDWQTGINITTLSLLPFTSGTVTSHGGSGVTTVSRGAGAVATDRSAGTPAIARTPGTPATPRS